MTAYLLTQPVTDKDGRRIGTSRFCTANGEKARRMAAENPLLTLSEVEEGDLQDHERLNLQRAS